MSQKRLIIFIPHIEGGGVEKIFFIITNFLAKKLNDVTVITVNKDFKKKLNKKIKIISPKNSTWQNSSIYVKYIISIFLLIRTLISNKKYYFIIFISLRFKRINTLINIFRAIKICY